MNAPTTTTARLELADYIHELTQPHTHREHYTIRTPEAWEGRDHTTEVPALLEQLLESVEPSVASEDGIRPGYASRPAARLDAIDTAARIDLAAARWIRDLGEDDHRDTIGTVRQLHGLTPSAERCHRRAGRRDHGRVTCCTYHAIETDVRGWWVAARVVTGWDAAPWKPNATCPLCNVRDRLLVKLADKLAVCLDCGETWDADNIGLLADHIRTESELDRIPLKGTNGWPCGCRGCLTERDDPTPGHLVLCPDCGRSSCLKATSHAWSCTTRMSLDAS